jgi:hypothetical protein
MSAMGTCFDWIFTAALVTNLATDEKSEDGFCYYDSQKAEATIVLHNNLRGRAALNGWIHENLHLISTSIGLDLSHKQIYAIASGLTQMATSTGVINEWEFEARLRRVLGPPEKLPEKP